MSFFFIISGYVFCLAYKNRDVKTGKFVSNRFKRLIIPLLFVKFFIWSPINVALGNYTVKSMEFISNLGHLWYLAVLFVDSIFLFFLMKKKTKDWMILVFAIVITLFSGYIPNAGITTITSIFSYFAFMVAGYFICSIKAERLIEKYGWIFAIVGIALFIIDINYDIPFFHYLVSVVSAIGWMGISINIKIIAETRIGQMIEKYSMPIYLFQLPIIFLIIGFTNIGLFIPPVVMSAVLFIVSGGLGMLIGYLMFKNKITKILIGC